MAACLVAGEVEARRSVVGRVHDVEVIRASSAVKKKKKKTKRLAK